MFLSEAQVAQFHELGYIVLDGALNEAQVTDVAAGVDRFVAAEPLFDGRNVPSYPELVGLVAHRDILAWVEQLVGDTDFTLHHCHAARHHAGLRGVNWHHDYEQVPQTNRSHLQVHVLVYLNGLDGTIGDLLLWPGSHRSVMRRDACWFAGTAALPGMVVLDRLRPGSVVLAHSALVHARRAQPGGEGSCRYFIDIAFCQRGITWPAYGRDGWEATLGAYAAAVRATAASVDVLDRYPHLFDTATFADIGDAVARLGEPQGSLAFALPQTSSSDRPRAGAIPVVG